MSKRPKRFPRNQRRSASIRNARSARLSYRQHSMATSLSCIETASISIAQRLIAQASSRAARLWQSLIAPATAVAIVLVVTAIGATLGSRPHQSPPASSRFTGVAASPQVSTVVNLSDPSLHPQQLAYDPIRNGLWFWTSAQSRGVTIANRIYYYDVRHGQVRSWPIYSGDWSSQILAGIAVAPDGHVWIGWNRNLLDFNPVSGSYQRYDLPAEPKYPLPAAAVGDLPTNLGIVDLAIAHDGTVWIARYGALSLTSFSPAMHTFSEDPLPSNAGDPAKITIGPDGHIFFTTNFSADHPGHLAERVGEYVPQAGITHVFSQPALAVAVNPRGDLFTAFEGRGSSVARLMATERADANAMQRAPVFQHNVLPFDVDGSAMAADCVGHLWVSIAGLPQVAMVDTTTGQVQRFQYAALSIAANPPSHTMVGAPPFTPDAGAVWLDHIVAMATDGQKHLWYVRAGHSTIEQVAA